MEIMLQWPNHIQAHLAQNAKCWCQPPGKAGPQKNASCSTMLHPRSPQLFSKLGHWYNFHCSIGYARTFLAACACCVCCWSPYTPDTTEILICYTEICERNVEGETSLLDSWTLGQVLLSSSTGLKEHLQCHIFLMPKLDSLHCCMFTHTEPGQIHSTGCPVHLFKENNF